MCPSVDLPAPRKPINATRGLKVVLPPPVPSSSPMATRTFCKVASSRCSSISRIISHSGEEVVTSPISSLTVHCRALATCNSTSTEALPRPYSILARWRSDTSAARARALRVMPRRARKALTRPPKATKNGCLAGGERPSVFVVSVGVNPDTCNIVLDMLKLPIYLSNAE